MFCEFGMLFISYICYEGSYPRSKGSGLANAYLSNISVFFMMPASISSLIVARSFLANLVSRSFRIDIVCLLIRPCIPHRWTKRSA